MGDRHDHGPGDSHGHAHRPGGSQGHGHGEPFVWQPPERSRRTARWLVGLGLALVLVGALLVWLGAG